MKNEKILLERYLSDILGIQIMTRRWKEQNKLPFFLTNIYDFNEILLLGTPCLLMIVKKDAKVTPAEIHKHQVIIQQQWTGLCIYVPNEIVAYNRKRLIEHHIPFIVPGNQLYLPDFGMDLREHYRKIRSPDITHFSPATQAVIIYALLTEMRFNLSEIATTLGYTLMTMTRAFNELEAANIGEIKRKGKERWWQFKEGKRDLWNQSKQFMKTPVKKQTWVIHKEPAALSGLSALAYYSMLNAPNRPIYAIGVKEWKIWKQEGIREIPSADGASFDLEIWHYDPNLFLLPKRRIVDPFSLYLSLESKADERIELALSEMMEKFPW